VRLFRELVRYYSKMSLQSVSLQSERRLQRLQHHAMCCWLTLQQRFRYAYLSVLPLAAGRLQRDDDQGAEDSSRGRRSSGPHSPADPATPATRSTSLALSQEVHSRT